jgi:hypothetical protein
VKAGPEVQRGALVSNCGRYRYRLWRLWDAAAPTMVWVLLNPSTADADTDDRTVRRCQSLARREHYGGVILVNLFAWRCTHPRDLRLAADPIGPENDEHILQVCREGRTIVAGGAVTVWLTREDLRCAG